VGFDCLIYDKHSHVIVTSLAQAARAKLRVSNWALANNNQTERFGDVNPYTDFIVRPILEEDLKHNALARIEHKGEAMDSSDEGAGAAAQSHEEEGELVDEDQEDQGAAAAAAPASAAAGAAAAASGASNQISKKLRSMRDAKARNKKANLLKHQLKKEGYVNLSNNVTPVIHSCDKEERALFPNLVLKALSAFVSNDKSIFQARKPIKDQNGAVAQQRHIVSSMPVLLPCMCCYCLLLILTISLSGSFLSPPLVAGAAVALRPLQPAHHGAGLLLCVPRRWWQGG